MTLRPEASVAELKGVGQAVATKLAKLGIETVQDLIKHYPRRYDDFSRTLPIRLIKPGLVTVRGRIHTIGSRRARTRNLNITEAIIADDTGTVKAVWFNQPYLKTGFPPGSEVLVSGKLEFKNADLAIQNSAIELAGGDLKHTARIIPVYPETEGLTSRQLRNLILPLVDEMITLPDSLPESVITGAKLIPYGQALAELHFPSSEKQLQKARHRIAFEEVFMLVLAGLVIKREIQTETAPIVDLDVKVAQEFVKNLDFEMTGAQRRAAWEILQDMRKDHPMNRLLEGDVGSGKTVVAMLAAVMAMRSGYQAALMVPTDILARQHFERLSGLVAKMGFATALLLGTQPKAERELSVRAMQTGEAGLVIGTHALISGGTEFKNLGLVIIDEQHRFGVGQRQTLKAKAGRLPHLLSMTATPIPRTLALTVYGDLDVSIINELPKGRKPVKTRVVRPAEREEVESLVDAEIEAGRQVFVVCPLIDPSDKLGARSVSDELKRLSAGPFAHRRIGAIHGRLQADEKADTMQRFASGELDILVATSVIEVGVDIPNATIMVIEGADRFGLAALHQMRGRVGRGKNQSWCFLLYDNLTLGAHDRLHALEKTQDGFRLAQIDLDQRGPGQIYGLKQHGNLELDLADVTDTKLVTAARNSANRFLADHAEFSKYPDLLNRVNRLKSVTSLD